MGARIARRTLSILLWGVACAVTLGGEEHRSATAPVMPDIHWSAEQARLFTAVPPSVAAWLEGALDDPEGEFESWHARYLSQSQSPAFVATVVELETLVKAAVESQGLSDFEVNSTLLPRLLGERLDIRKGVDGTASPLVSGGDNGDECYRIQYGRLVCNVAWWFGCLSSSCNTMSPLHQCQVITPIPCPDASNGIQELMDDPSLPIGLP